MKNIIITGANGGLGSVTVKKFLEKGYNVIAVDNTGNNLVFAKDNPHFSLQTVDLSNETAAETFINESINRHKKINAALLLVGGFAMGGIDKTTGDDLKKMYSLNFETAFYTARPLFNHMLQNNYGRIVLIGARPALKATQGKAMMAYALSKSLLFKLAEFLNEEAKNKNVITSVVVPSTIDTPANRESMPDADPKNWVAPEQLADLFEFICNEKASALREPVYKVYNNA